MSIIEITIICSQVINLAMQQNHVPVIRQLLLHNTGDTTLADLTVSRWKGPRTSPCWPPGRRWSCRWT